METVHNVACVCDGCLAYDRETKICRLSGEDSGAAVVCCAEKTTREDIENLIDAKDCYDRKAMRGFCEFCPYGYSCQENSSWHCNVGKMHDDAIKFVEILWDLRGINYDMTEEFDFDTSVSYPV